MKVIYGTRSCFGAALIASCALWSSCSTESKVADAVAKTDTPAPPAVVEPLSGKTAYWEMYASARKWSTDAVPLEVKSKEIPGIANGGGKAAMWTAMFASPSKSEARVFTYAIAAKKPDIYKGVSIGRALPWNGPSRDMLPFQMSSVNVDSDAAYKAGETRAAAWLKQHPGEEATLTLRSVAEYSVPVWGILWGDNKKGYRSLVNGVDGTPITNK